MKNWWKVLCVLLLGYVITAGFLMRFPVLPILHETIRNVFYHVSMWYAMIICFVVSGVYALSYLMSNNLKHDLCSKEFAYVGIFFGCLGMITGMEWANVTWGVPWNNDPKQIGAALNLLSYFAYWVLRISITDNDKVARIAAVYNVLALALLVPLLYIIPAHSASLHPGADGNNLQALYTQSKYLRIVQLPGMIGWILLSVWIATLRIRLGMLKQKIAFKEINF